MRSAIDIASSWSWVTTTNVMPTSCCSRLSSSCISRADLAVERGQRLIEQQQPGSLDDGPRQRHPLPLAAGQLRRTAARRLRDAHASQHLGDPLADLVRGRPSRSSP